MDHNILLTLLYGNVVPVIGLVIVIQSWKVVTCYWFIVLFVDMTLIAILYCDGISNKSSFNHLFNIRVFKYYSAIISEAVELLPY